MHELQLPLSCFQKAWCFGCLSPHVPARMALLGLCSLKHAVNSARLCAECANTAGPAAALLHAAHAEHAGGSCAGLCGQTHISAGQAPGSAGQGACAGQPQPHPGAAAAAAWSATAVRLSPLLAAVLLQFSQLGSSQKPAMTFTYFWLHLQVLACSPFGFLPCLRSLFPMICSWGSNTTVRLSVRVA